MIDKRKEIRPFSVTRATVPDVQYLNLIKYLSNKIFHQAIQIGTYPHELKSFILQETDYGTKLEEYREKLAQLKEQQELQKRQRLIRRDREKTRYFFDKFTKDNREYKLKSSDYYSDRDIYDGIIYDLDKIKTTTGWEGNEIILEDLIAQLLNYTDIRIQRQFALREKDKTAKVGTRRVDLVLFYKYRQHCGRDNPNASSLICIELKTNYIDINDVTDSWYTKQYLQKTIEIFPYVRDATMLFLSPLGITENAARKLEDINHNVYRESNFDKNVRVQAYSTTVNRFLNAIKYSANYAYRDEEGAIGKQWSFVKPEVEKIIWKINNPNFWLEEYLNMDSKVKLEMKYEKS